MPDWVLGTAAPRAYNRRACLGDRRDREDAREISRFGPAKASRFIIFVALAAIASTVYLALEAAAWAALYLWVGALSASRAAMLYSLSAITSYGHADVYLEDRWQLLGAIEAVNGVILFGLTTAFLYAAIHEVWPLRRD